MGTAARILEELVSIPSVYPGAEAGGSRPGEEAMAKYLAHRLRRLGADVAMPLLEDGRPNVVALLEPAGKASATVILMPHLDTVGVQGMTVPPFALTRRGGRLHGRGSCDTKGPLAALLAALEHHVSRGPRARGSTRWVLVATAGEESGGLGAEKLFAGGLRADFAVALEPTMLRVVNAAKGVLRVWIQVPGRAAHGSRPQRGVNAVYRAVPLVEAIRGPFADWLREAAGGLWGGGTVNLGILQGGRELNIVPDSCRLGLDVRLHPGLTPEAVLERLASLCSSHCPGATLSVIRSGPAFDTPRKGMALRLRKAGAGWARADWFCDANFAAAHGIPAVAFGPGDIRQAHTCDEFIEERQLEAGVAAFRRFLEG